MRPFGKTESVAAHAADLMHFDIGGINISAAVEAQMVIICPDELKIAELQMFHFVKSNGDLMDSVGAAGGVSRHIYAFLRARIDGADLSESRNFDVFAVCAL